MTYLVDSDWIADYLKGRQQAIQLLDSLFRDGMAVSIISFAEIYEGIYYGSDPKRNEEIFAHFLQGVDVLGINRPVARRFAMLRGALREAGQLIPQPDIFIAATALHYDLSLVTRNISDFQRIPGLKIHRSR